MASGLIALLDDVAAIAKVAAASLDDAAGQAVKVGGKATGIVIDDAAVTPRYVVGFAADRELPIIGKIAAGSLRNKLLFLLPAALALSLLAPWLITPLLMAGGAFLCLEGYHKVLDLVRPHEPHGTDADIATASTPEELERERVESAIRTDFILSAEIMAISLAAVQTSPLWLQAALLAIVAIAMTGLVYGAVALIVKADDVGVALARSPRHIARAVGRGLVAGMPTFLRWLSLLGMAAMLWVGGQILVHGLHGLGDDASGGLRAALHAPEELVRGAGERVGEAAPALGGALSWLTQTAIAAAIGLLVGAATDPLASRVIAPAWKRLRGPPKATARAKP